MEEANTDASDVDFSAEGSRVERRGEQTGTCRKSRRQLETISESLPRNTGP
jgi:hypothetical protein